jgi:hypothetical protein
MKSASHQATRATQRDQSSDVVSGCVDLQPAEGSVALSGDQHLRMRDADGWTIKAGSGTLWITQESDSRDIVLKAGDSFVLDRPGSALVSSLDGATIFIKRATEGLKTQGRKVSSKFLPSISAAFARLA